MRRLVFSSSFYKNAWHDVGETLRDKNVVYRHGWRIVFCEEHTVVVDGHFAEPRKGLFARYVNWGYKNPPETTCDFGRRVPWSIPKFIPFLFVQSLRLVGFSLLVALRTIVLSAALAFGARAKPRGLFKTAGLGSQDKSEDFFVALFGGGMFDEWRDGPEDWFTRTDGKGRRRGKLACKLLTPAYWLLAAFVFISFRQWHLAPSSGWRFSMYAIVALGLLTSATLLIITIAAMFAVVFGERLNKRLDARRAGRREKQRAKEDERRAREERKEEEARKRVSMILSRQLAPLACDATKPRAPTHAALPKSARKFSTWYVSKKADSCQPYEKKK